MYFKLRKLVPSFTRTRLNKMLPPAIKQLYNPFYQGQDTFPLGGPLKGYKLKIQCEDERQYIVAEPSYEPAVCQALITLVSPGMSCADVGANIGYTTLLLAHLCRPDGCVYAFEALPENAKLLHENMRINQLEDRVMVEPVLVSNGEQDSMTFYEGNTTFEFSIFPRPGYRAKMEVPAVKLDNYFSSRQIDFLKVDVEGAEIQVLEGMSNLFNTQRPTLLIELHHQVHGRVFQLLREQNYSITDLNNSTLDNLHEGVSHIIARSP